MGLEYHSGVDGGEPHAPGSHRLGQVLLMLAALLAVVAIGVLVVRVGQSLRERDRALQRERHAYEVVLAARGIAVSSSNAEAALGRYAISADRQMGMIYYDDWVTGGERIALLRTLTAGDPVAASLVDRLATLYAERGEELGPVARSASRHQGWAALELFNAAGRSPRIGAIRETLHAIREHENNIVRERADQSDEAATDTSKLIGLLSLTGLVLIVAAGGLAIAFSVARQRQCDALDEADEAADRAAWLRHSVAERTRELQAVNARLEAEIGERAAAEAKLRQMQKMEAVGQLTGGIAHDFNNMLAVVVGGLELARRRLPTAPIDAIGHIDHAMEGANRAAALTRRLLGFARAEPLLPERVDPATLIAGMSDLLDRSLGERVVVRIDAAAGWPVFVDPLQFENAILNLAVNGRDAMDGAGTLAISAADVTLGEHEIGELPAGDYARISVTDAGKGMTPALIERVFEPFFTTKPVGKGTGLGLSQIFGFARESGGDVAIASVPGTGTTVSLYLPRAVVSAVPAPLPRPIADVVRLPVPTRGPEKLPVLLVEDDARVRAATASALDELGYETIVCADAGEALAALADRVDLRVMVTDVVMPVMTGPELAAEARRRYPDLSVLFVTGFTGEDATALRGEAMLRKPFTVAALERAVAAAFSVPPPGGEVAAAG